MKKIVTLIWLWAPFTVFCQNLTGTWEGSGGGTTYIKLVVQHRGDSLIGYTYDEGDGYCKATFIGRYNKATNRLVGHGVEIIDRTPNHVLVDYDLGYTKEAGGEFLREKTGEAGFLRRLFGADPQYLKKTSSKIDFRRKPAPSRPVNPNPGMPTKPNPVDIPKKAPLAKRTVPVKTVPSVVKKETVKNNPARPVVKTPRPPVMVQSPVLRKDTASKVTSTKKTQTITAPVSILKRKEERVSRLVETIYTSSDTVKMYVYDNGEVDGDTVTVFFDNAVILNRYHISEKAKELFLPISKSGQEHSIELFANNLGTIPPNTALIIIMAGRKRYELRTSYDLQTNAKIIIQYRD